MIVATFNNSISSSISQTIVLFSANFTLKVLLTLGEEMLYEIVKLQYLSLPCAGL